MLQSITILYSILDFVFKHIMKAKSFPPENLFWTPKP